MSCLSNIIQAIGITTGKEILEKLKIIEVKILELDVEVAIEMRTLEELEVCLEIESIQVILEEMIRSVVDLDQIQEQVLIEIGLDVLSV